MGENLAWYRKELRVNKKNPTHGHAAGLSSLDSVSVQVAGLHLLNGGVLSCLPLGAYSPKL